MSMAGIEGILNLVGNTVLAAPGDDEGAGEPTRHDLLALLDRLVDVDPRGGGEVLRGRMVSDTDMPALEAFYTALLADPYDPTAAEGAWRALILEARESEVLQDFLLPFFVPLQSLMSTEDVVIGAGPPVGAHRAPLSTPLPARFAGGPEGVLPL